MRRPAFFILVLSLAIPAQAGVVRVPAVAAPAAVLGGLLGATLPSIPALSAAAPMPVPALLDTNKALALVARAQALPASPVPAVAAPAAEPLRVLEAVNSVMRDFTPEDIRDMPEDQLQALSSVIMDGAAGNEPKADLVAAGALSRANLARVERLRGTVAETLHNPGHDEAHGDIITSRGVPGTVKRFDASGVIFRHYTTEEGLDAILKEKSLRNGFMPYVELASALYAKTYRDLTGVFLTLPKVAGDRVGVPAGSFNRFVDLRVPAGLPVLEIERDSIFLVPMPARTRGWVADLYRRWVRGEAVNPTYQKGVEDLEKDGGTGPALNMPIEIVGHGRAGG